MKHTCLAILLLSHLDKPLADYIIPRNNQTTQTQNKQVEFILKQKSITKRQKQNILRKDMIKHVNTKKLPRLMIGWMSTQSNQCPRLVWRQRATEPELTVLRNRPLEVDAK